MDRYVCQAHAYTVSFLRFLLCWIPELRKVELSEVLLLLDILGSWG